MNFPNRSIRYEKDVFLICSWELVKLVYLCIAEYKSKYLKNSLLVGPLTFILIGLQSALKKL